MDAKKLYERKAALLQQAVTYADDLDAEDARKAAMRPVFELGPGQELSDDQYDGMEEWLGDDILPTDWNPEREDPPHEAWFEHIEEQDATSAQEDAGDSRINTWPVFELEPGRELAAGQHDGMEEMLGDDTLETDWDIADGGVPPPGFWAGTHTRHGERIPGFSEAEYLDGDSWEDGGIDEKGEKA